MGERQPEVLIVGAGPTAAVAALVLAENGISVLCLEQGDWVDEADLRRGDPDWPERKAGAWHANPNIRRGPADDPIDDRDSAIRPMLFNGVGGSTVLWSAHMPRFKPADFRMKSEDGVGDDWPIGYDDLAPHYDVVERLCGTAVRLGDPLAPPRRGDYPPPLPIGASGERIAAAFDRLGWHWWPVDRVLGEGRREREVCRHAGPCDFACPVGRAAAADHMLWPKALAAGARLVNGARVLELEPGPDGRVAAAVWLDRAGKTRRVSPDHVIVAANGLGTPKLLLQSATGRWPAGLANRSGLVGRNLMLHVYGAAFGAFDMPFGPPDEGPTGGIVSHQFYRSMPERGFLRGFKLQLIPGAKSLPLALKDARGAGDDLAREVESGTVAGLTVCGEDLPEPDNRITLSGALVDRTGRPAARMIYRLSQNSRALLDFGLDRADEVLTEAGATRLYRNPLRIDSGFHLMGTARMGTDPERSVVDPFGRSHDHHNLFVVDSSVFVTSTALNPANTAMAIARRAALHLVGTRRDDPV